MPENEPTIAEVVQACQGVLQEEDLEEIRQMPTIGEALGYAYSALIQAGISNPDELFISKNILI